MRANIVLDETLVKEAATLVCPPPTPTDRFDVGGINPYAQEKPVRPCQKIQFADDFDHRQLRELRHDKLSPT